MAATTPLSKLCVSVAAESVDQALALARQSAPEADVIEVRLDTLASPAVRPFVDALDAPLLFTNRAAWEGGGWQGSEEERVGLLCEAAVAGAAYVDIELNADEALQGRLLDAAKAAGTKVIVSWHDFKVTPSVQALSAIFQRIYRSGGDIGKIVTTARHHLDVLRVLSLQEVAAEMELPLIAFCMGGPGVISRVATCGLGGFMTYCAPDGGRGTAAGQLAASAMRQIMGLIDDVR